jgi:hypothetical protein
MHFEHNHGRLIAVLNIPHASLIIQGGCFRVRSWSSIYQEYLSRFRKQAKALSFNLGLHQRFLN